MSPFFGATDNPGDVSSGIQSQSGQPYLHLADAYVLHVPLTLCWKIRNISGSTELFGL